LARLALASSIALALNSWAQTNDSDDSLKELENITITGSRIKRSDVEGPTPVLIIQRSDFEEMGYRTVQDVLNSLTQNTGGGVTQQFVFGFTPGASSVNLRGFGSGRTLVLVDGRRIPVYPLGIGGTTQFFDTSNIPTAIIERIEILTDGASAIYGSDAIGGVVNVITRKEFEGMDLRLRTGDTDDGGYQTNQAEFVAGTASDDTSMYLTVQYDYNDELMSSERDFASSDIADPLGRGVFSTYGSNFVEFDGSTGSIIVTPAPNCGQANGPLSGNAIPPGTTGTGQLFGQNVCSFNRTAFRQLFPENETFTVAGRVDHELRDNLSAFATVRLNRTDTHVQIEPFPYAGTGLFGGASANPVSPNSGGLQIGPNGFPGVFVRRMFEYGPRRTDIETQFLSGTFGLQGNWNDNWDWEAALSLNKQDVFSQREGSIIISALEAQIDAGLDLFQPIPASVVAATSYTPFTDAESKNTFLDFQFSGLLPWDLAGGPVALAGVLEFEDQEFFDKRDPITLAGDGSDGGSAGGGDRDRLAAGFEVAFPLHEKFEIDLAGRWDDYNDDSNTGSAVTGKLSFQYRPLDNLLLRASVGESFRAPDLQRLFGSTTRAFTSVVDSPLCVAAGGDPNAPGGLDPNNSSDPCDVVQSVRILVGSNIALEEEEGDHINLGAVWEPFNGFSVTADFYDIELENIIAAPSGQFILNQCAGVTTGTADQSFCNLITRDAAGTLTGGQIAAQALNLSIQSINGVDLSFRYDFDTAEAGLFNFEWQTSYVNDVEQQFSDSQPLTDDIGLFGFPEYRHNLTVGWDYKKLGATVRLSYVDELGGINAFQDPTAGRVLPSQFIDDYVTVNTTVRYDFGDYGNVQVGINNLLDEDPPVDPTNANWPWFFNQPGYYSVVGREWHVQWQKRWN
jgi:iron complex outermembrane receptor protein